MSRRLNLTPPARVVLVAILAFCLVAQAAHVLYLVNEDPSITAEGDSRTYTEPARALLEDGEFNSRPGGEPEFLRTPGYPAFIAVVYKVFGESLTALLLVQVAVSVLTVLLVFLLAAHMWSVGVGLVAAAVTTIEPLQHYSSGTIVSERLGTLLLVLIAATGYRVFADERPALHWAFFLGLAMACATMVRPVTYYLPVLVLVLFGYRFVRGGPAARLHVVKIAALFLVPLVVIVGGWQWRNHREVGSWRLSGVEAKNIYLFRAAAVVAAEQDIDFETAKRQLRLRLGVVDGERQGEYYARMYSEGFDILAANPGEALRNTFEGLFHEVVEARYKAFEYFGFEPASGLAAAAAVSSLLVFYVVTGYGIAIALRDRRVRLAHLFVIGIAIYVLLVSAGPEAVGGRAERFRAPVMPIFTLYAARGAVELWHRAREARAAQPGAPLASATQ